MPGTFKKLNANDIKITPFEAHKQYDTVDLPSIGATTASLAWNTDPTTARLHYQFDKLYYRNYIQERAHRLELNDATYTTQERRLYQNVSVLSLSQKTFGSEVQPGSFELNISKGGITYNIQDDGFGNLYDTGIGKDEFPNEDNRVFYLAPVNGYKRADLTVDYTTGNSYVNSPFSEGYSETVYDDSYFLNKITYFQSAFQIDSDLFKSTTINPFDNVANDIRRVTIENRPYLNFNDDDFCISFFYEADAGTSTYAGSTRPRNYILTKEGAQNSAPLGSQAGGEFALNATGALDITTIPANPAYPYRVYVERPSNNILEVYLERFDGETTSLVSGSFYNATDGTGVKHILLQKRGSKLQAYFQGILESEEDDLTTKPCQNKADATIFDQRKSDGSYHQDAGASVTEWGNAFRPTQFQIWNRSMEPKEIIAISESFTGTYPIGNLFYDNGFAALTHPKYMELFDGGTLNTLKYKNTHLITENEYQCSMTEDEFEFTTNPTARKIPSIESEDIADFTTGSAFKPYVTTVGLHDDDGNLLVVGKLGQPIKASSETDTTFVIRFDT